MDLTTLQRQLLGLIKSTYQVTENDDPYIQAVAQSEHLKLVQEIVVWWRGYGVERYCVFTSTLLKRRNLFDEAIRTFVSRRSISPFIEKQGTMFLEEMSSHKDSLVASLAQFELALIKVRQGDQAGYIVNWKYNPYAVLNDLIHNLPFDEERTRGPYQMVISRKLPNLFKVI